MFFRRCCARCEHRSIDSPVAPCDAKRKSDKLRAVLRFRCQKAAARDPQKMAESGIKDEVLTPIGSGEQIGLVSIPRIARGCIR